MPEPAKRLVRYTPGNVFPDDFDDTAICYWKGDDGVWWIYLPRAGAGRMPNHSVLEHEDGTISVTPSILLGDHRAERHGYLTRGQWHEA